MKGAPTISLGCAASGAMPNLSVRRGNTLRASDASATRPSKLAFLRTDLWKTNYLWKGLRTLILVSQV